MGNSNSQLKRSRSRYGSTRSVAFSVPSNWGRHRYAYDEQLNRRPASIGPTTPGMPPKPILRTRSLSGSENVAPSRGGSHTNGLSRSLHSLPAPSQYEQDDRQLTSHSSSNGYPSHLTQTQFNDVYLNNDLRRVFRAQDRSNSVANITSEAAHELDPTNNLDRKLLTLKAQRQSQGPQRLQHAEERKEGATERRIRSRKSKKAPQPNAPLIYAGSQPIPKAEGLFKKKGAAPNPPLREKARSLSSLTVEQDGYLVGGNQSTQPLFQQIEDELERRNIPISPTKDNIDIPKPDYDGQRTMATGVLVMPPLESVKLKKAKPKAPPVPIKVDHTTTTSNSADGKDIPREEATVSNAVAAVEVHQQPLQQTVATQISEEASVAQIAEETMPVALNDTPVAQSSEERLPVTKKEMREIAIQYDAPVEIAIQCSGHTLKQKNESINPDHSSLTELLHMFNEAIKAGKVDPSLVADASKEKGDSESICSKTSSSCERNALQQKVVPMHQVLAGIPEPPPLPDLNVKFLQKRTIKDDAPVSLAPLTSVDERGYNPMDTPPRKFSSFQQQLLTAYEKIEQKRKSRTSSKTSPQSSISNQSLHPLEMFRYSESILGIQTPQEAESDSGHDEPSDSSNSQEQTPSIPDFVLAGIVTGIHPGLDNPPPHTKELLAVEQTGKKDKSKFNSIKRLKKSVRQLMLSKRHNSIDEDTSESDITEPQPTMYSDSNWTLSGRTRTSRKAITEYELSPPAEDVDSEPVAKEEPPKSDSLKSSPSPFKQTNLKSFSLLTPSGYPGTAAKKHQSVTTRHKAAVSQIHSLADVPL